MKYCKGMRNLNGKVIDLSVEVYVLFNDIMSLFLIILSGVH